MEKQAVSCDMARKQLLKERVLLGLEQVGAVSSELWLWVCGFGASGLRGWRFAIVDIYAGKGIIGVGNFIFSLCCILIIHPDLRKVVNLDADVSVDGL